MFTLRYDKRIPDDLSFITAADRKKIQKSIEIKLTARPEVFGKPLRHSLLGFRSLRVGDYRVIYIIQKKEVSILVMADGKRVYDMAAKRMRT